MHPDGGGLHALTHDNVDEQYPAYSPDGTKIAFVRSTRGLNCCPTSQGDVYVMNADGTNVRQLAHDDPAIGHPTWSPDGTRIAFEKSYAIWVVNADGTGETAIYDPPGSFCYDPAWSPDGSRIAVAGQPAGGGGNL